ncbi:Outer envelope protein 80, chloroplastic [Stylosanthes scabra]|uniref:Outer envelope protein 80, chloroplastic n=1 Tax=Stylosanthes scabra TaxID=79078 RepID=A0ABU6VB99_9FABA|nr:Outer envelope protein 80, chloroplastic [Stylosanthes scabra]
MEEKYPLIVFQRKYWWVFKSWSVHWLCGHGKLCVCAVHAGACSFFSFRFLVKLHPSAHTYTPPPLLMDLNLFGPVEGVLFSDYGTDLGTGSSVPGDPAGARFKPGSGCGCGFGIRVDSPLGPLRLEYAFNDKKDKRFHFGVGYRN